MKYYMVFDVGGSSVKWAVMDDEANFVKKGYFPTPKTTADDFFDRLAEIVNNYKKDYYLDGIALSCTGSVDSDVGVIGGASAIDYIHGPNFKKILKEKTGLEVELENDANSAALGECWKGNAKDYNDVIFIICGSGIGGSVLKNKTVHKGSNLYGGEFGYMIMSSNLNGEPKFELWSGLGSTISLVKNVAVRKGISPDDVDGKQVFELAKAGDLICIEEVDKFYYYMAMGIYNLQYAYDPEIVLVGGAVSAQSDFIEQIDNHLDKIIESVGIAQIKPKIAKCKYGNDANLVGALYHYLNRRNL